MTTCLLERVSTIPLSRVVDRFLELNGRARNAAESMKERYHRRLPHSHVPQDLAAPALPEISAIPVELFRILPGECVPYWSRDGHRSDMRSILYRDRLLCLSNDSPLLDVFRHATPEQLVAALTASEAYVECMEQLAEEYRQCTEKATEAYAATQTDAIAALAALLSKSNNSPSPCKKNKDCYVSYR